MKPEYIPPAPVTARGKAPGLQFRLLSGTAECRSYVLAFGKGDEAASGLIEFAERQKLRAAHFTGIGAFRELNSPGSIARESNIA